MPSHLQINFLCNAARIFQQTQGPPVLLEYREYIFGGLSTLLTPQETVEQSKGHILSTACNPDVPPFPYAALSASEFHEDMDVSGDLWEQSVIESKSTLGYPLLIRIRARGWVGDSL